MEKKKSKKQKPQTIEEYKELIKKIIGETKFGRFFNTNNKKRLAEELVYETYEQPISKGKKLIKLALELDPDNVGALNFLAGIETNLDKAIDLYKKAIENGEKSLGKEFFEEAKGHFWGIIDTRPYMRAKAGLAECYYIKGEVDKAIEIYKEMLELNPSDNQGIRYLLSILLLGKDDLTEYESFMKEWDFGDYAIGNYNNALYSFKKFGRSIKTDALLLKAYESNPFVIGYILDMDRLPDEPPEYIVKGRENEAIAYVFDSWRIWHNTKGVIEWLKDFKEKLLD